jgi:hypothetical protein
VKFKNRFEEWQKIVGNLFVSSDEESKEIWDAAEKPLLKIIAEIVEEDNAAFFSDGNHMHSLELRKKIAELFKRRK